MKKAVILVLDNVGRTNSSLHEIQQKLLNVGIDCDILWEYQIGNHDSYEAPDAVCQNVNKLSSSNAVDAIIIGNNTGCGLKKAMSVSNDMKNQTVIVWTNPDLITQSYYRKLGFNKFSTHETISIDLPKLIEFD